MKFLRLTLTVAALIFGSNAHAVSRDELLKQIHDSTHLLVRQDSTFKKSIQEILPKGVSRLSTDNFSNLSKFSSFVVGKANAAEVKQGLGEPVGISQEKDGRFIFSYDAPKTIISYVFATDSTLEASYGYSLSW